MTTGEPRISPSIEIVCLELLSVMLPMNDKCFMDNITISHNHISPVCELFLIYYTAAVLRYYLNIVYASYWLLTIYHSDSDIIKVQNLIIYKNIIINQSGLLCILTPQVYLFEIEFVVIYLNIILLLWLNLCNRANRLTLIEYSHEFFFNYVFNMYGH